MTDSFRFLRLTSDRKVNLSPYRKVLIMLNSHLSSEMSTLIDDYRSENILHEINEFAFYRPESMRKKAKLILDQADVSIVLYGAWLMMEEERRWQWLWLKSYFDFYDQSQSPRFNARRQNTRQSSRRWTCGEIKVEYNHRKEWSDQTIVAKSYDTFSITPSSGLLVCNDQVVPLWNRMCHVRIARLPLLLSNRRLWNSFLTDQWSSITRETRNTFPSWRGTN